MGIWHRSVIGIARARHRKGLPGCPVSWFLDRTVLGQEGGGTWLPYNTFELCREAPHTTQTRLTDNSALGGTSAAQIGVTTMPFGQN